MPSNAADAATAQRAGSAAPSPTPPEALSAEDEALMRDRRLQRNLKILIGVMTAMIFAGLAAIFIHIVSGSGAKSPATQTASRAVPLGSGETVSVDVPADSKVVGMTLDGNRLAIEHHSTSGVTISIIDVESGERIRDIRLRGAVPRN